ncbi:MAG: tetratricopeptide repeat protein [Pyrinomonadaceae bacterium]
MKRCPQCRRDYYDETLLFCLDDGNALLDGPASGSESGVVTTGFPSESRAPAGGQPEDEPQTAILSEPPASAGGQFGETATRAQVFTTEQTAVLPSGITDLPQPKAFDKSLLLAPIVIAVIVLGGFFGYKYFSPAKQIQSIAVMPFVNESKNQEVEYLSDGMTDTLISSLSQLANLNVKGRSSVFRYKGKDVDTKTLGVELGVQAILYGRVIQRGEQLSLSLELLDAGTENVIWSGKYDRKQSDVVTLQSEIARDVSNKLKIRLSGADAAKVEKGYTADPEAYKLYLQGRFYWNKRTAEDLKKSIGYFEQAIAHDAGYALAYSGLGAVYQVIPGYTSDPPPSVVYLKAQAASLKALEIDPTLAEPHATLGVALHEYEWKHSEAENEYKRAIELDPNYPSAHQWYGNFLLEMGRYSEGIMEMEHAAALDPLSPIINSNLGRAYRAAHRYDDAIVQYKKTLEIAPNFRIAMQHLFFTYMLKGMFEEAMEIARQALLSQGVPQSEVDKRIAEGKNAYRVSGAKGFWQLTLETDLEEARAGGRELDPYLLAFYQLGSGNKEKALGALEKAVAMGPAKTSILWLKAEPNWDPLRDEPRFKAILREIGLPE